MCRYGRDWVLSSTGWGGEGGDAPLAASVPWRIPFCAVCGKDRIISSRPWICHMGKEGGWGGNPCITLALPYGFVKSAKHLLIFQVHCQLERLRSTKRKGSRSQAQRNFLNFDQNLIDIFCPNQSQNLTLTKKKLKAIVVFTNKPATKIQTLKRTKNYSKA